MLGKLRTAAGQVMRFALSTSKAETADQTKAIQPASKYGQKISKARTVFSLYDLTPIEMTNNVVLPNATVIGDVKMGSENVICGGVVIRGDINSVFILEKCIIGQGSVLFTAASVPNGMPAFLRIQSNVVIQPNCTLYSCTVHDDVFIGSNTVVMQGAVLERGCIIAPNSVVPPGRVVPTMQVWGGNPIKYIRDVEDRDIQSCRFYSYMQWDRIHDVLYSFLPYNNAYLLKKNSAEDEVQFWDEVDPTKNILERGYDPYRPY